MTGLLGNLLAPALADAYLRADGWNLQSLRTATLGLLGREPEWTVEVATEVLAAYPVAPTGVGLAEFVTELASFRGNVPGGPAAAPGPAG